MLKLLYVEGRSARARLQACAEFDAQRRFLVGHVERDHNRYKVGDSNQELTWELASQCPHGVDTAHRAVAITIKSPPVCLLQIGQSSLPRRGHPESTPLERGSLGMVELAGDLAPLIDDFLSGNSPSRP
jgi:hypothetical protein